MKPSDITPDMIQRGMRKASEIGQSLTLDEDGLYSILTAALCEPEIEVTEGMRRAALDWANEQGFLYVPDLIGMYRAMEKKRREEEDGWVRTGWTHIRKNDGCVGQTHRRKTDK